MWKAKKVLLLALVGALAACTQKAAPLSPEKALETYVNTGFSARSAADKQKLLELSVGEAHDDLAKMSDADFESQFVKSKLRYISFKTKDVREENNGDVSMVYELSYEDNSSGVPALMTNKKIAFLTRDSKTNEWRVKSTTNVKSLMERKDALEVLASPPAVAAPAPQK